MNCQYPEIPDSRPDFKKSAGQFQIYEVQNLLVEAVVYRSKQWLVLPSHLIAEDFRLMLCQRQIHVTIKYSGCLEGVSPGKGSVPHNRMFHQVIPNRSSSKIIGVGLSFPIYYEPIWIGRLNGLLHAPPFASRCEFGERPRFGVEARKPAMGAEHDLECCRQKHPTQSRQQHRSVATA